MRHIVFLISSLFALFLMLGCTSAPSFGLKKDVDCDALGSKARLTCLHEAAVSAAYGYDNKNMDDSVSFCNSIRDIPLPDAESIKTTQANQCLYDIAIIAARNGYDNVEYAPGHVAANPRAICNSLPESDALSILKSEDVTRNSCISQVEHLQQKGPIAYQRQSGNLCASAFVLFPLIGLGLYLSHR